VVRRRGRDRTNLSSHTSDRSNALDRRAVDSTVSSASTALLQVRLLYVATNSREGDEERGGKRKKWEEKGEKSVRNEHSKRKDETYGGVNALEASTTGDGAGRVGSGAERLLVETGGTTLAGANSGRDGRSDDTGKGDGRADGSGAAGEVGILSAGLTKLSERVAVGRTGGRKGGEEVENEMGRRRAAVRARRTVLSNGRERTWGCSSRKRSTG
jgi:hypothetical protein